jgi:hypothetical protein
MLVCGAVCAAALAQANDAPKKAPLLSPPATATVSLNGKDVSISYNSPSMRGRVIMGGLVPYGKVWRTGANPATTIKTDADLMIGTALVPAGTYTLFTLPSADTWKLIINKQTGQWGLSYNAAQDLGRVKMTMAKPPALVEKLNYSLVDQGAGKGELRLAWENHIGRVAFALK